MASMWEKSRVTAASTDASPAMSFLLDHQPPSLESLHSQLVKWLTKPSLALVGSIWASLGDVPRQTSDKRQLCDTNLTSSLPWTKPRTQ